MGMLRLNKDVIEKWLNSNIKLEDGKARSWNYQDLADSIKRSRNLIDSLMSKIPRRRVTTSTLESLCELTRFHVGALCYYDPDLNPEEKDVEGKDE